MLVDQIKRMNVDQQPMEMTLRMTTINDLRQWMARVELAYQNAKPGTVLIHSVCEDIRIMLPKEAAPGDHLKDGVEFNAGTA